MITQELLEKHFKHHDKLVVYQNNIPLTITKAWHLHFSGGHHEFDIEDCADFVELCKQRNITLKSAEEVMLQKKKV